MNFLMGIEARYPDAYLAPYHNATHACDVLQQLHLLYTSGGLAEVKSFAVWA